MKSPLDAVVRWPWTWIHRDGEFKSLLYLARCYFQMPKVTTFLAYSNNIPVILYCSSASSRTEIRRRTLASAKAVTETDEPWSDYAIWKHLDEADRERLFGSTEPPPRPNPIGEMHNPTIHQTEEPKGTIVTSRRPVGVSESEESRRRGRSTASGGPSTNRARGIFLTPSASRAYGQMLGSPGPAFDGRGVWYRWFL